MIQVTNGIVALPLGDLPLLNPFQLFSINRALLPRLRESKIGLSGGIHPSLRPFLWARCSAMAKTKISSTDLVWLFHEELQELQDAPRKSIPIAILPVSDGAWVAITTKKTRRREASLWEGRIKAIQKKLQAKFSLID